MKRWIFLLVTLAVMALIFLLSGQPGTQSYALSAHVAQSMEQEQLTQAMPEWFSTNFHANLRKWAHVWLYFLLGASVALTVCAFRLQKLSGQGRHFLFSAAASLGICVLYAAGDELHQYFVPGRACLATDILVDAMGFVPGILLVCLVWYGIRRHALRRDRTP